ncbi:MAG: U32 family peptidase [Nanoarchaeota archaeon]|nr:U32 family peptidase [Nanoarchaeota archaeon]
MVELLAPAGDWESLTAAVKAGCNSVYFGMKSLNMRASTRNFELTELRKVASFCHENNVRCYLCVNTIVYDNEMNKLKQILEAAKEADIDAIIAWDFSVIGPANKMGFEVHVSTQASVSNIEAIRFYSQYADQIVLARELDLDQIKELKEKIKKENIKGPKGNLIQIEAFAHGAMCVAVSGRCFTSQFLYGKSANRGDCLQPCRRSYQVTDIAEDKQLELENRYIMSPKDLCTINFVDKLINSGIDVLKIEGRNRAPEYVDVVISCYKRAIDAVENKAYTEELKKKLLTRLKTVYNRKFSSGFYMGVPMDQWTDVYGSDAAEEKVYIGVVVNYFQNLNVAEIKVETHDLKKGDNILIIGPTTGILRQDCGEMQIDHKDVDSAEKGQSVAIKVANKVRKNDKLFILRKK